jgi:hypothetical protein
MTIAMPRRAFLASSAAAVAAPAAAAAPLASETSDAVFEAIAAFRQANAAWLQSLEDCAAADRALQAENAYGFACLRLPLAEREIQLRDNDQISAFIGALRDSCAADGIAWNDAHMADVAQGMRDELETERKRVEMIRCRVNADALEERQETAMRHAGHCADAVLATVPTTLAGLHAFAELMAEMAATPGMWMDHHEDSSRGLASLATACRALLPAA